MHYYTDIITHGRPFFNQSSALVGVNNTVTESHLSVTSGSSRERTRAARFIDKDANDCAISPPPPCITPHFCSTSICSCVSSSVLHVLHMLSLNVFLKLFFTISILVLALNMVLYWFLFSFIMYR